MKFIKLDIKNIASIENTTIDFASPQLANEKLFLIYGNTGTGKSTLLDAICLALYDNVPRFENLGKEEYVDKALNVTADDKVQISNTLQLVRRYTMEAYAKLTFEGNDGNTYVATWRAYRGARLNNLNVQLKKEHVLEKYENGVSTLCTDKKTKYFIAGEAVVGLDFDQFVRTSLLAQGQFAKFVAGSSDEKSVILEKLTDTRLFTEVGRSIFNHFNLVKDKSKSLKERLGEVKVISEVDAAVLNKRRAELKEKEEVKAAELKLIDDKIAWLKRSIELDLAKRNIESKLNEIALKLNSEEIKNNRTLCADWDKTTKVRLALAELKKNDEELKECENLKSKYTSEFSLLVAGLLSLQQQYKSKEECFLLLKQKLASSEANAEMFAESGIIIEKLKAYNAINNKICGERDRYKNVRSQIPLIEKKLAEITPKKALELEKKNQVQTEQETLKKQISAIDEKGLKKHREELQNLKMLCGQIANYKSDLERKKTDQINMQNKVSSLNKEVEEMQQILPKLEERLAEANKRYEMMEMRADLHLKIIRQKLSVGDTCPICGSVISSKFDDENVSFLLEPLKTERENAETNTKKCRDTLNLKNGELKQCVNSAQSITSQLYSAQNEYDKILSLASSSCVSCGLELNDENLIGKIEEMIKEVDEKISNSSELYKIMVKKAEEEKLIQKKMSDLESEELKLKAEKESKENELKQIVEYAEEIKKEQAELQDYLNKTITNVDWNSSPEETMQWLKRESEAFLSLKKEIEELDRLLPKMSDEMGRIKNSNEKVREALSAPHLHDITPCEVQNLETRWSELSYKANELNSNEKKCRKKHDEINVLINQFLQENPAYDVNYVKTLSEQNEDNIKNLKNSISELEKEAEVQKSLYATRSKECVMHNENRIAGMENADIDSLTASRIAVDQERTAFLTEKGAIEQQIKINNDNLTRFKTLTEDIEQTDKVLSQWERLSALYGDSQGKKFRKIVQSLVLQQVLENANYYLRNFTPRYVLEADTNSLVILVRDVYLGGEVRAVSTLSGGETFMTSLALALGLSSLNQNRFTPDILFIDEGFGTLGEESLDMVISTLETMYQVSGGRRIGMISHVVGLRERIRTQIQVKSIKDGISSVTIKTL